MTIFHIFDAYRIRGHVLRIVTLYRVSKEQHRLKRMFGAKRTNVL